MNMLYKHEVYNLSRWSFNNGQPLQLLSLPLSAADSLLMGMQRQSRPASPQMKVFLSRGPHVKYSRAKLVHQQRINWQPFWSTINHLSQFSSKDAKESPVQAAQLWGFGALWLSCVIVNWIYLDKRYVKMPLRTVRQACFCISWHFRNQFMGLIIRADRYVTLGPITVPISRSEKIPICDILTIYLFVCSVQFSNFIGMIGNQPLLPKRDIIIT